MSINTPYDAGRMDRRVLLQVGSVTKATNGERTETWSDYDWRWAEMMNTSAAEGLEGDRILVSTSATFRMRFDAVVTEKYRLIYRNRIFNIIGVNEVDRKRFMDVMCDSGDIFKPITADDTYLTADADTVTADSTMY